MATTTATATDVGFATRSSPAAGLPQLRVGRPVRPRCIYSKKASSALAPVVLKGTPLAAASALSGAAAMALVEVDERMSAERTWLSDDLLGWALLVAVGLVLSLYTVYSSIFDDDDQSGAGGITL